MKFSVPWLKEFVKCKLPLNKLAEVLNAKSFEVEVETSESRPHIFVGEVLAYEKHPNADRLRLVKIKVGKQIIWPVVCGASNFEAGDKIVFAFPGAQVRDAHDPDGKTATLEKAKIRGVESLGMLLSVFELEEGADHSGILVLPKTAKSGERYDKFTAGSAANNEFLSIDLVSTNRSDIFSHYGLAREIAVITHSKLMPIPGAKKLASIKSPTANRLKISIKDVHLCPRYIGVVLENIKVGPAPEWIAARLKSFGIKSINNVVDVTNFVMLEFGNPLHAFDADKIGGRQIVVRPAKKGEVIRTLDNEQKILNSENLVIADGSKPIAVAGVIGGLDTAITSSTNRIVLEAANFNSISVRSTTRALNLQTEAATRFIKSISPHLAEIAVSRAADLLIKYAGARIVEVVEAGRHQSKPLAILLSLGYTSRLLGKNIEAKEIKKLLANSGFLIKPGKTGHLAVTPPEYRTDIKIEEDIIEEIGRLYGLDKIPALPAVFQNRALKADPMLALQETLADFFVQLGYMETKNYSFVSIADLKKYHYNPQQCVAVANPLSADQAFLRPSLLINLLKTAGENAKYFPDLKIFEIGTVFKEVPAAAPSEEAVIGGLLWQKGAAASELFRRAKGVLSAFAQKYLKEDFTFLPAPKDHTSPLQSAVLCGLGNDSVGEMGLLKHDLAAARGLKQPTVHFFLSLQKILKYQKDAEHFRDVFNYPRVVYDISLLADKKVTWQQIIMAIKKNNPANLQTVELFDEYEGQNVPAAKRSLAFHLVFQNRMRTLRDEEVRPVYEKIIAELVNQLKVEIRN